MSGKSAEAWANLQRISAMFGGILELGPELQKHASLEAAIAELEGKRADLAKSHEAQVSAHERVIAQKTKALADLETQHARQLIEHQARCDKATADAEELIAKHKRTARGVVEDADAIMTKTHADATSILDAARKTAAGYEDLQKSAAAELEHTRAELAAKKSALDDINARLAAISRHAE